MTAAKADDNLKKFFRESVNTTTRERIFFSRLSFDLKIAAARAGYHLHLYELRRRSRGLRHRRGGR